MKKNLAPLGGAAEVLSGFAFKSEWFEAEGTKVIRIGDIEDERVNSNSCVSVDCSKHKIPKSCEALEFDILMALSGATTGKIGIVDKNMSGALVNQRVAIIRADNNVTQRYLRYIFSGEFLEKLLNRAWGAAQANLSPTALRELEIPLPAIEEQQRIAAILDKADGVRRKRKEAIALTEALLRSAFLEMFGDPVTNPKGWGIWSMRDVIQNISTGWSAGGEDKPLDEGDWGVLKISAVTTGRFISTEYKNVGKPPFKNPTIVPKKGDLLFTRANTRELVAATCLVEEDCKNLFLPDKIWSIEPIEGISTRAYLRFLLAEPKYRSLITKKATGTSGSMLNVSQKKLLEMNAPIPPIDLQRKFSDFVWKSFSLRQNYELATKCSDHEFNSLLQRAFRGEL